MNREVKYRYIKQCSKCKQKLIFDKFYQDKRKNDGYKSWCKKCVLEDNSKREYKYKNTRKKYRENSKSKAATNKRNYYKENKDKILDQNKNWRLTKKGRFHSYKKGAENRGLSFDLTEKEFLQFWKKPCYYCGSNIETIGLDRLDSNIGYKISNIVPCCEICNKMKLILNYEEFLNHVEKIFNYKIRS